MSKYNVKSKVGTIVPDWIVEKMLDEQKRQVDKRYVTVFEKDPSALLFNGFAWADSEDGYDYWFNIICRGKYPEEPKEEPKKYPRVMMISNDKKSWYKRVVEFEKTIDNEPLYFAWNSVETIEDSLISRSLVTWKYAKEINPENPKQIELTLYEIAEMLGISVENLKIKK